MTHLTEQSLDYLEDIMSRGCSMVCKKNRHDSSLEIYLCDSGDPKVETVVGDDRSTFSIHGQLRRRGSIVFTCDLDTILQDDIKHYLIDLTAESHIGRHRISVPIGTRSIAGVRQVSKDVVFFDISA